MAVAARPGTEDAGPAVQAAPPAVQVAEFDDLFRRRHQRGDLPPQAVPAQS